MRETTQFRQSYYVRKRKQTWERRRGPTYENPKQEFESMTGYKVKDPEVI